VDVERVQQAEFEEENESAELAQLRVCMQSSIGARFGNRTNQRQAKDECQSLRATIKTK